MMIAFHKIISRKAAPGVYHGPPIFFSPSKSLNSKMYVYAVDKGADFGAAIARSGILSGNGFAFFVCNASTNNPLGNGYILLIHSPNYWRYHPQYIRYASTTIESGVLNCEDTTAITK